MCGDVAAVKRKCADVSELWLDDDALAFRTTKSRRLDADVPSDVLGAVVPPSAPQTQPVVEEVPVCGDVSVVPAANEERAIVLYRPAEAAHSLLHDPLRPGVALRVRPDWIHGLKGTMQASSSSARATIASATRYRPASSVTLASGGSSHLLQPRSPHLLSRTTSPLPRITLYCCMHAPHTQKNQEERKNWKQGKKIGERDAFIL